LAAGSAGSSSACAARAFESLVRGRAACKAIVVRCQARLGVAGFGHHVAIVQRTVTVIDFMAKLGDFLALRLARGAAGSVVITASGRAAVRRRTAATIRTRIIVVAAAGECEQRTDDDKAQTKTS
jgi:hypothetical protein